MISNTNGQIKWTKDDCNNYSIENLTEYDADVTITSHTSTYVKELTISPNESTSLELPSDGVYKVSVDGQDEDVTINSTSTPTLYESFVLVYQFDIDPLGDIDFRQLKINNTAFYSSPPDLPSDTGNPTNFINTVTGFVPADPYRIEFILPNTASTLYPFLPQSTGFQVAVRTSTYDQTATFNELQIQTPSAGLQTLTVANYYQCIHFADYPVGEMFLTSLVIGSISTTDLLALPTNPFKNRYDLSLAADVTQLNTDFSNYLSITSNVGYVNNTSLAFDGDTSGTADLVFAVLNGNEEVTSISYSDLTITLTPIEWHDYLYELCALHKCIISKLNDYLCSDCDPCAKTCDQDETAKQKKAKEDLHYISTLFFNGLVPLITSDRLNYMGDLVIDESRVACTMKIIELYDKLVDFVNRCGECEDECEDCGCGCNETNTSNCNNC